MSKGWGIVQDSQGNAIDACEVKVYLAGTSTLASIFSDSALSVAIDQTASPVTTDATGHYQFFIASGSSVKLVGTKGTFTFTEDHVDIGFSVPAARTISTTSPLTGGGDLSANRTLAFDFSTDESVTGRWTLDDPLLKGPVHDVRAYGATGDGVTDDAAAIQTALDALDAAGGGMLFFPPGQYNVSTQIDVPSDVVLCGVGYSSRIHMTANDTKTFQVTAEANVGFERLLLTSGGTSTTAGNGAIHLGLSSLGNGADDCWVSHCWIEGAQQCGITIDSKSNRCSVTGCLIDSAGEEGIYALGADTILEGNGITNSADGGIKARGTNQVIVGNRISGATSSGVLFTDPGVGGVTAANVITGSGSDGIRVAGDATDHAIIGNYVEASSQSADNTHSNISIDGAGVARVFVQANTCRHGGGAAQPKYGLELTNSTDAIVGDNDLRNGGKTAQFFDSATNTQGVRLKAREQAATGNTSITSATDADVTGCSISVTPLLTQTVIVHATADVTRVTADTLRIGLDVNGANQGGSLLTNIAGRQMISGFWVVTLTGGTAYTIKLEANVAGGSGEYTISSTHTKIALTPAGGPA